MKLKLRQTLDRILGAIHRPFRKHLILTGCEAKEDPARIEYYYKCPYCGYEFVTSCLSDGTYCHICDRVSIEPTLKNIYEVL